MTDASDVPAIIALMDAPTTEDRKLVEKAYAFAAGAHRGHTRLSGEPYMTHLVATAKGLARLGMGAKTIAAGLLHDSVEDVEVSPETIEKEFGKEVRFLVDGVTKLGTLKYHGNERHVESLRKLLVATSKDARVLIIKLMDRLHNMQTLSHVSPEKRERIARETLDIYAAIAHRLGIGVVRRELEDLGFEYAYPKEFAETKKLVVEREKETRARLDDMTKKLRRVFAEHDMRDFVIESRVKGFYSLWQKLKRKGGDIEKIYDLAAVRIIVDNISNCYRALGIVHQIWQPLPNKIKDYIAFPKPNGYQSIHTTVFAGDGGIVEIQIRTRAMHEASQLGIAAHVDYKESGPGTKTKTKTPSAERAPSSFDWIKSLIPGIGRGRTRPHGVVGRAVWAPPRRRYGTAEGPAWLADLEREGEAPDFETALKTDIFRHRVFVFTPKGDVVDLPVEATPIDFAYAIHSDIGDHVGGVKVNGKLVPLHTVLQNGDIVEIETKKSARPTQKWLDIAKTTLARRHIRNAIEKETK